MYFYCHLTLDYLCLSHWELPFLANLDFSCFMSIDFVLLLNSFWVQTVRIFKLVLWLILKLCPLPNLLSILEKVYKFLSPTLWLPLPTPANTWCDIDKSVRHHDINVSVFILDGVTLTLPSPVCWAGLLTLRNYCYGPVALPTLPHVYCTAHLQSSWHKLCWSEWHLSQPEARDVSLNQWDTLFGAWHRVWGRIQHSHDALATKTIHPMPQTCIATTMTRRTVILGFFRFLLLFILSMHAQLTGVSDP